MNQVKAGAVLNYVIIVLNTLIGLLYTPYMLRCLGQNEYGVYSLVASVIAYLTLLDFGFGNAIIRYTAKYRAEGRYDEQWRMFGMFIVVYSVIGLVAFWGGLCLYFNVDALFDKTMSLHEISQARVMMLLLTANLAFTFPLSVFGAIITAYENFVFQRVVSIIRILLMTAVMIALLAIGYKAISLVVIHTVFNLAVLLINVVYCFRKLRIKVIFERINFTFLREIVTYSFWIFLNAIMDKIYWGTGQFVLGALSGSVAVAIFSVAIMLQQMYMTFSTSINSVLLPKVTAMVAKQRSDSDISQLFIKTGRLQYLVLGLILSGFIVFGRQFIDIWAGKDYSESYVITVIFFVALLIPLIQNTGIVILQARNQMRFRSLLYLGISAVSLIFQYELSKSYGALGCAIAIGAALVLGQGVIMNIYYARQQHIDIAGFWKQIIRQSLIPLVFTGLGLFVMYRIEINNFVLLGAIMCIYVGLYILCIWNVGMNKYEKDLIKIPIKRISSKLLFSR